MEKLLLVMKTEEEIEYPESAGQLYFLQNLKILI